MRIIVLSIYIIIISIIPFLAILENLKKNSVKKLIRISLLFLSIGWGIVYLLCQIMINLIFSSNSSGLAIMTSFFYTYIIVLYIFIPICAKKLSINFFKKSSITSNNKGLFDKHQKKLDLIFFLLIIISMIVQLILYLYQK